MPRSDRHVQNTREEADNPAVVFLQPLTQEQCENCHFHRLAMKHLPPRDGNRTKINTVFVMRQILSDIWQSAMQDN